MTADRPHGKDMITLKSHKTVIPGRAEGERRGHVPKSGATEAIQPNCQEESKSLGFIFFLSNCFPKQIVELLRKSVGIESPAKLPCGSLRETSQEK